MLERGIVAGQKAERFTGEDDGQLSMQLLGMLLSGEEPAAIRHLCRSLPASEHRVVYLCDCAVKPLDLYRMLAAELGLKPSPRAQIVSDIKAALVCRLALFAGFCPTIKAGFRGRDARRAWGLEVQ